MAGLSARLSEKGRDYFRDIPIRFKLSIIIILAIGFALLIAGSAVLVYESRTFEPRSLEKMGNQADILAEVLIPSLQFQDSAAAVDYLGTLRYWKEIKAAAVYDMEGRFFAGYRARASAPTRIPIPQSEGGRFHARDLIYCAPISRPGEPPLGYLWLDQELLPLYARLPQYGIMFGVVVLSLSAVAALLALALKQSVSLPIVALSETARSVIARRDYSLRASGHGRDEIGSLQEVFNQMLEVIEARDFSLRKSEERFSKAFLASPIPITILRMSDNAILDANESNLELLGFAREEVIGRNAVDLGVLTLEQRGFIMKHLAGHGAIRKLELKIRTKTGGSRDILLSMEPIELDGEPCLIATSDDITDRIETEGKLRQSQKMEAIGQLAGGVAHDFNNILTAIIGYTSMSLDSLEPSHPLYEPLRQVLRSGERAAGLTRQLLAYGRKQILEFKPLDLALIVREMEGMLRRLISENIELTADTARPGCLAWVDRGQVEQVILNLVINARDAMPEGGKLFLSTSRERLGHRGDRPIDANPGMYAVLIIRDTGTGMTEEVKARLFEPYFTTKDLGKGTGLGLSVVYGIVKQSGGAIAVESAPGNGSIFRVYFREAVSGETGAKAPGSEEPEDSLPGSETILLVEDEILVREMTRKILEGRGYKVLEAVNGSDALRMLNDPAQSPDLVVTDVVMPDMGGRALVGRLKREGRRADLPVLFISGYPDVGFRGQGGLEPGDRFLQKPFTPAALIRTVRDLLAQVREGEDRRNAKG